MNITVHKTNLLDTLRSNREEHVAMFQKAIEKYHEAAIDEFEKNIARIKAGKDVVRNLNLRLPEEHTDDYDRAIEMLGWSIADTIELDSNQFEQLVRNKWGWQQSFASNTASYVSA